jgi:hypothetical protein
VASFTSCPLYSRRRSPRYILERLLGGPQILLCTTWRRDNFCPYRDSNIELSVVQSVASCYTACAHYSRQTVSLLLFYFFMMLPNRFQSHVDGQSDISQSASWSVKTVCVQRTISARLVLCPTISRSVQIL